MINLELNEEEMRHLAEMSASMLLILSSAMPDGKDKTQLAWQSLCSGILQAAREIPSIGRDMQLHQESGYWLFKEEYINQAFYADVIDEYRDSVFWDELVSRLSEQALNESIGIKRAERLSDEERDARTASLREALWQEMARHGISRLAFVLPPNES